MAAKKAPWDRPAPKPKRSRKLTTKDKSEARQRAKRAGRSYPNLVDNMAVAKKKGSAKKKGPAKKKASAKKKGPAKKKKR